jgi:hypothetical protein
VIERSRIVNLISFEFALSTLLFGSSRISWESYFDFEEEVVCVAIAVGHAFDDIERSLMPLSLPPSVRIVVASPERRINWGENMRDRAIRTRIQEQSNSQVVVAGEGVIR